MIVVRIPKYRMTPDVTKNLTIIACVAGPLTRYINIHCILLGDSFLPYNYTYRKPKGSRPAI